MCILSKADLLTFGHLGDSHNDSEEIFVHNSWEVLQGDSFKHRYTCLMIQAHLSAATHPRPLDPGDFYCPRSSNTLFLTMKSPENNFRIAGTIHRRSTVQIYSPYIVTSRHGNFFRITGRFVIRREPMDSPH